LLIFGWLVVLLVGSLWATDAIIRLQGVDWYQYEPTYFVLKDLNSNQIVTAQRAWAELVRRDAGGSLSAQTRDRLVKFALVRQGNAKVPYNSLDMDSVNYLGNRAAANDLAQEEMTKFFEQAVRLRLVVRPKVLAGDPVPYAALHDGLGPSSGFWTKLTMNGVAIDGKNVRGNTGGYSAFGSFGSGSSGSLLECRTPGKHAVSLTFRIEIFSGAFDAPGSTPLYRSDRTVTGGFEVLATRPANLIQAVFDPKRAVAIKAAIALEPLHFNAGNGNSFTGSIDFRTIPVNFAFDVYARHGGTEWSLGTVTCSAGTGPWDCSVFGKGDASIPPTVDIILRPSEKAARETVDEYSYWNQELIYQNVPVARP
jgi:hypothetical protein